MLRFIIAGFQDMKGDDQFKVFIGEEDLRINTQDSKKLRKKNLVPIIEYSVQRNAGNDSVV